ncbi:MULTISPECIES: hypothetical protein [unclassified Paraflavitalea]|uniref:hypothetical protein n=1 Tax=unclassified Paraflavitalea TaxID=2798305 RepID=UPI003D331F82
MKSDKISRVVLLLEIALIILLHVNKSQVNTDTTKQSLPGIAGSPTATTGMVISQVIR